MRAEIAKLQDYNGFRCIKSGPIIFHLFFTDDSLLFFEATTSKRLCTRRILDVYSRESSHVINFDKSGMCVSNSIFPVEGDRLSALIGVRRVRCHELYLGLPSFNCKNKRQMFNNIKDRIWNKIKGWRCKILSVGGGGDRWLSRPIGFKVITLKTHNDALLVSQLRTATRGWNETLIRQVLLDVDDDVVLSIPTSNKPREDSLCWHYTIEGSYTVTSGYKVGVVKMINAETLNSAYIGLIILDIKDRNLCH
ncbi:hypothetical protein Dsin_015582 [Dipteronia sinensis]|uniref:Uncharacterized protein n=1 Tax=Dipteronia sinensis TaxID=43782 RepID=A0AAE0E4P6_9ROSI|nr:hypothetical protein Dsin_015582 [Dipteronia sinensis]